jgi:predicted metal-dependent phosphoesterase TrpH
MSNSNGRCDLHIHTCFSDGRASPEEVLNQAAFLGLRAIAITDHDNTRSFNAARPVAEKLGIELIPGIEFTCRWQNNGQSGEENFPRQDIDLLGYGFDPENAAFQSMERAALDDIHERIADCATLLTKAGYPITLAEALEQNPRYGGAMQLIDALWRKGTRTDWNATLALFNDTWPHVRLSRFHIREIIETIHRAGGVAVLAHPVVINNGRGWLTADDMAVLVEMGLDGIEIYHPRLYPRAQKYFLSLARMFQLLVTGGSDEHGWPTGFPRLGSQPVTRRLVADLKARCRER